MATGCAAADVSFARHTRPDGVSADTTGRRRPLPAIVLRSGYFALTSAKVATYLLPELEVRVIPAGLLGLSVRLELAAVQVITKATWPLLAEAEVIA